MPEFIIDRRETTVHTLRVNRDTQEQALIAAGTGPMILVTGKEGIELVSTTKDNTPTFVVPIDADELRRDLHALMVKHNCCIEFNFSDGTDTHGIIGEKVEIVSNVGNKVLISNRGYDLNAYDLYR